MTKVFGNREKSQLKEMIREAEVTQTLSREFVGDPDAQVDLGEFGLSITTFDDHARAMVKVQDGCSAFCTFCIIPFGRGNSRSLPLAEITAQTRILAASGYKEVVLTGVDLTSYDQDGMGLGAMTRALLDAVPELPRLRLSSIDVAEIDDPLMDLIAHEPRLMPHLHLSLQAGDDMVLKRMKRRHSRRSEEHTSELQSQAYLVCRLLLYKKNDELVLVDRRPRSTARGRVLD